MIKNGVTTISDHWYLHTDFASAHRVAEVFRDAATLRRQLIERGLPLTGF